TRCHTAPRSTCSASQGHAGPERPESAPATDSTAGSADTRRPGPATAPPPGRFPGSRCGDRKARWPERAITAHTRRPPDAAKERKERTWLGVKVLSLLNNVQ